MVLGEEVINNSTFYDIDFGTTYSILFNIADLTPAMEEDLGFILLYVEPTPRAIHKSLIRFSSNWWNSRSYWSLISDTQRPFIYRNIISTRIGIYCVTSFDQIVIFSIDLCIFSHSCFENLFSDGETK